ncbi:uncharacterized protein LOC106461456 [Limulus polyphemus]|uniref:Uncharacterized protein LOC106461456 n=1 Tax=Limulus polyphemus TaxID=6850 RepID=A0ABM1B842_LIMPO|nr:uncharacterized protein LOC106461456 [Limulus polyphemus]
MAEENIVEEWLRSFHLSQYAESFLDNGYDDLEICKQIGEADLDGIGVTDGAHRQQILRAVRKLLEQGGAAVYFTLEEQRNSVFGHPVEGDSFPDGPSPYLSTTSPNTVDKTRVTASKGTTEVTERTGSYGYGCCGGMALMSAQVPSCGRFTDEYEEGKAEFVKLPKMQLKMMIRDKLIRDGIRLSAQPYSNMDGSRGELETLAKRYSEELRTHYQDVVERLEELRRRRVVIDVPPLPLDNVGSSLPTHHQCFRPGKYSPSSCLSEIEYENVYGMYEGLEEKISSTATSPERCLSPRSRFFYEPSPLSTNDTKNGKDGNDHKKKGGLGKLFRSLGPKKDRDKGRRFPGKTGSKVHNFWSSSKHHNEALHPLPQSQSGDLWIGKEGSLHLMRMIRDGYMTIEHAVQKGVTDTEKGIMFSSPGSRKDSRKVIAVCRDVNGFRSKTFPGTHIYYEPPYEFDIDSELFNISGSKPVHSRQSCRVCSTLFQDVTLSTTNYQPAGHYGYSVRIPQTTVSNEKLPTKQNVQENKCTSNYSAKDDGICDGKCGNIMCSLKVDSSPEWPPDTSTGPPPVTAISSGVCESVGKNQCCYTSAHACTAMSQPSSGSYSSRFSNTSCCSSCCPQSFTDTDQPAKGPECGQHSATVKMESLADYASSPVSDQSKNDQPGQLGSPLQNRQANPDQSDDLIQPGSSLESVGSRSDCGSRSSLHSSVSSSSDSSSVSPANKNTRFSQSFNPSQPEGALETTSNHLAKPSEPADESCIALQETTREPFQKTRLDGQSGNGEKLLSSFSVGQTLQSNKVNVKDGTCQFKLGKDRVIEDVDGKDIHILNNSSLSNCVCNQNTSSEGSLKKQQNGKVPEGYQNRYCHTVTDTKPRPTGISRVSLA